MNPLQQWVLGEVGGSVLGDAHAVVSAPPAPKNKIGSI